MKLFNVIITWDAYVVAEEGQPALDAVLEFVKSGELDASHKVAHPVVHSPVRLSWQGMRPVVAADVSDADFKRVQGKTTQQVHDLLFKKEGKP